MRKNVNQNCQSLYLVYCFETSRLFVRELVRSSLFVSNCDYMNLIIIMIKNSYKNKKSLTEEFFK